MMIFVANVTSMSLASDVSTGMLRGNFFRGIQVLRTCRITAHRFPLVHVVVDIYVPPTATYLQYRVIGLTPMAVGLSQSLAQRSGTVSRISLGTRQSALTLSDVC